MEIEAVAILPITKREVALKPGKKHFNLHLTLYLQYSELINQQICLNQNC